LKSKSICWNLEAHEISLCMVTSQKMGNTATNDGNLSISLWKRRRGIADQPNTQQILWYLVDQIIYWSKVGDIKKISLQRKSYSTIDWYLAPEPHWVISDYIIMLIHIQVLASPTSLRNYIFSSRVAWCLSSQLFLHYLSSS
jgi:hypothetical protein